MTPSIDVETLSKNFHHLGFKISHQHMENSVCFLHIIFESFPKSFKVLLVLMKDECRIIVFF